MGVAGTGSPRINSALATREEDSSLTHITISLDCVTFSIQNTLSYMSFHDPSHSRFHKHKMHGH